MTAGNVNAVLNQLRHIARRGGYSVHLGAEHFHGLRELIELNLVGVVSLGVFTHESGRCHGASLCLGLGEGVGGHELLEALHVFGKTGVGGLQGGASAGDGGHPTRTVGTEVNTGRALHFDAAGTAAGDDGFRHALRGKRAAKRQCDPQHEHPESVGSNEPG